MKARHLMLRLLVLGGLLAGASGPAAYGRDRFHYCRDQAERISGYYGPVPDRYLPGGAARGAVRGAVAGAAIGGIGGNNAGRAARRGAAVGALVGAARRERARDDYRDRRYIYQLELDRCMDRNYR